MRIGVYPKRDTEDFVDPYEDKVFADITLGAATFFFPSVIFPVFSASEAPSTEPSSSSNSSLIGALS